MTDQFNLFDPVASQEAAEEAIGQATEAADPDWKEAARSAVRRVAYRQRFFTTDDIWGAIDAIDPEASTHEPRAMGGILRWAQDEGLASNTERVQKTARVAAHRRPLAVWESLVYREVA
jgi:hypothetical protein